MKTAPHLVKHYINEHFSTVPGTGCTCCKLLGLLIPISIKVYSSECTRLKRAMNDSFTHDNEKIIKATVRC